MKGAPGIGRMQRVGRSGLRCQRPRGAFSLHARIIGATAALGRHRQQQAPSTGGQDATGVTPPPERNPEGSLSERVFSTMMNRRNANKGPR
jgi:hypothetical protein